MRGHSWGRQIVAERVQWLGQPHLYPTIPTIMQVHIQGIWGYLSSRCQVNSARPPCVNKCALPLANDNNRNLPTYSICTQQLATESSPLLRPVHAPRDLASSLLAAQSVDSQYLPIPRLHILCTVYFSHPIPSHPIAPLQHRSQRQL